MSYGNLSSTFKPKEEITEDDIRKFLRKEYELDEDSELTSLDTYAVVSVKEDGSVKLDLSDEINSEDFDEIEGEWKKTVNRFADFADGAIHVTGDYESYDDGEKDELDYYIGPARLTIQAEIADLEKERDRIEGQIAQKRRELSAEI
jgi:hypothetical protein